MSDIVSALKDASSTKGYPKNSEFEEKFAYARLYAHGDNIDKVKLILETLEDSSTMNKLTLQNWVLNILCHRL